MRETISRDKSSLACVLLASAALTVLPCVKKYLSDLIAASISQVTLLLALLIAVASNAAIALSSFIAKKLILNLLFFKKWPSAIFLRRVVGCSTVFPFFKFIIVVILALRASNNS